MRNVQLGMMLLAAGSLGGACARESLDNGDSPADKPGIVTPGKNPNIIEPGIGVDGGVGVPFRLDQLIVADTPPPPMSGGTLAVAADGSVVVAADPDRDLIYVVRPDSDEVETVKLARGSEPGRVALSAGRAHVALRGRGSVVTIDLATATLGEETPVCTLPRGVAFDAAHDALLVACAGGELVTLKGGNITRSTLDLDLRDVIVRADGSLAVTRYRSAELLAVTDGQVKARSLPRTLKQFRSNFTLAEDGFGTVDAGIFPGPQNIVTMSPTLAWKSVAAGDDGTLMLHQESQDDEVVISSAGGYGGGCETITQSSLTYYDSLGKPVNTLALAPHGLVVDVAVSPDGRWAALAEPGGYLRGMSTLEVLSIQGMDTQGAVADLNGPGIALDGGIFLPPSCAQGAQDGGDFQITAVAFDAQGVLYALSREPAQLLIYEAQNPFADAGFGPSWPSLFQRARYELASTSVRDTGHELFHADVGSGLSCAGCHGEALDDSHVWNFAGFGPRRTQTMRGGLLSTLPLHWEGDLPTFKNLVDEVMTRRMGGFKVEDKYSDALAQWLDKQAPVKLGASDDAAARRGQALFESSEVGCAVCHSGAHYTNNRSYNVGTDGTFQVPTLLGVALHPPFLHDGCAQTLEERFRPSCGGGDAHGHTSQLSDAEIADLVSYLKTL